MDGARLVTHYVLFAIDVATRAVEILGVTPNPDGAFMAQVARNVTTDDDGVLRGKRFLIVDRGPNFDRQFRRILSGAGVRVVRTAAAAPNMNAFAERFVRTIKDECLSRLIFFGEGMLRRVLTEFVAHYHEERPHQGIGNVIPRPGVEAMTVDGPVLRRERLGGLLSYYCRKRRAG